MKVISLPEIASRIRCRRFGKTLLSEFINQCKIEDAIIIPEGATNEDMIKAMFPDCEQKEHINNGYFEMYFDNDLKNASYMRVSKDWWNAPYKRGGEE